jgi:arylsulfatase A-like enzyme
VLLIVLDTARADAFEPYGAAAGATPTFAQLASSGTAINRMYAPACWTVPSHGAMFTGLLPRTSQIGPSSQGNRARIGEMLAANDDRLLPVFLQSLGYDTGGLSCNAWISPTVGFDRGFDKFEHCATTRKPMSGSWRDRLAWTFETLRSRVDDGAAAVERFLDTWIAERRSQPFFWFVNLVECHSPYLPPKPYNDLGPIGRMKAGRDAQEHLTFEALTCACLRGTTASESELERMRHLYEQSIRMLDDWVARVLDKLDRAGVLDETIVIVTSDHGENFGENQLLGHGYSLDERLLRVPFVVAGPCAPDPDRLTTLMDVPRMLADAIGLDEHPWHDDIRLDVAVAQLDPPCDPADPTVIDALHQFGLTEAVLPRMVRSLSCATDGRLKLFREGSRDTIVDLEEDPLESASVPVGRAHEVRHGEALVRLRSALDAAELQETQPQRDGVLRIGDPDLERQLKLLGYA